MTSHLRPVYRCSILEVEEGGFLVVWLFTLACHLFGVFPKVCSDYLLLHAHLIHPKLLLYLWFVFYRLPFWLFWKYDSREGLEFSFDFKWLQLTFNLHDRKLFLNICHLILFNFLLHKSRCCYGRGFMALRATIFAIGWFTFLACDSRNVLGIEGTLHKPIEFSLIVDVPISYMKAFSAFVLFHKVILFFQQFSLSSVIAVHQLCLPHHLKLYSFLNLLTLP